MFSFDVLLLLEMGALVLFAPITGYIASSHGRSFWRWFGIGIILPFVSLFIVIFVAIRSQLAAEKAARRLPKPPPAA